LRLAFVYGEGDPHLAEAVRWAQAWHPEKRFHMVHHADVAQAVMLAIARPEADEKLYNVADGEPVAASEILCLNGMTVTEEASKIVLDDPWEGIVDTTRIQKELGFRPIYPSVYMAKDAQALW
jgi:nucleoside-diphosphate-sugar epimerase